MWKEHPVKVAHDHSAIVAENEYGVLIDMSLCVEAMWNNLHEPDTRNDRHYYDGQKYRYMIWSNIDWNIVGAVEEQDKVLTLTLMGYGFQFKVTFDNVIQVAVEEHSAWALGSLDPVPDRN